MTPLDITRNDPLTQIDGLLLSISSVSEDARFDIARFGHFVYDYCLRYNEWKAYHNFASSFRGSRATYSSNWREKRLKVVLISERIKAEGPILYNRWGGTGRLGLWDEFEELAKWWDTVYMRAESWTSEIESLAEPQLAESQVREEKPKPPKPKLPLFLEEAEATKKAMEEAADRTKPAKTAPQSTDASIPGSEQRPQRRFENLGRSGMDAQIQSHSAPSTSRAEERGPVTGPIPSDRPSVGGASHKPERIDNPELGGVIPHQSHGWYHSTRSPPSEPTRDMDTMHISQQRNEHAPATRSVVQPSAGTTSSSRSVPSTTTAPSASWDSTRTHDEPEGSW